MLDLSNKIVELLIREDGKVLVMVNGICELRVQNPKGIIITDKRPKLPPMEDDEYERNAIPGED